MAVKAKRGTWLAVVVTETTYYIGQPNETRERIYLERVTSCTRDGYVKDCEDVRGYKSTRWQTGRVLVIPADVVAPEDVRRVALAHHYPSHPGQPMPWDSLTALRSALARYRIQPTDAA